MTHTRTTRRELDYLVTRLEDATGQTLVLDVHQPGDSRTPYRIEDGRGRTPYGERRRSAGELADCIRFALNAVSFTGEVREADGPCPDGYSRYTAYVEFDGDTIEEIDVDALAGTIARAKVKPFVQRLLDRDYQPGGRIVRIDQRYGLYL